MKTSGSFGLRACAALAALGFAFTASADIPASAYVQSGLVAQFDGIENAGAGRHDNAANVWVDLAGVIGDAMCKSDNVVWQDDCWSNDANGTPFEVGNAFTRTLGTKCFTLEVRVRPTRTSTRESFVGNYGKTQGFNLEHNGAGSSGCFRFYCNGSPNWGSPAIVAADQTISAAFVAPAGENPLAYTNGVLAGTCGSKITASMSGDHGTILGGEYSRATMAFHGSFYSVRLYDRALTADEIAVNANVDKIRFENVDPAALTWPDGYRVNAASGKVECHVQIVSNGENPVSLDGETFATEVEGWYELGAPITAWCQAAQGRKVFRWDGAPHNAVVGLNQISFAAGSCTITPVIGYDIPASAYAQDGLVAQWDGIENAGTGTHDASATTWVDLKGSADVTLGTGDSVGEVAGVTVVDQRTFAGVPSANDTAPMTLEISAVETSFTDGGQSSIFFLDRRLCMSYEHRYAGGTFSLATPRDASPGVLYFQNVKNDSKATTSSRESCSLHTYSAILGMSKAMTAYYDGASAAIGDNLRWSDNISGAANGSGYVGSSVTKPCFYSIRLYNRTLMADEIVFNAAIDQVRFEGADPAAVLPEGYCWNDAKKKIECHVKVSCDVTGDGSVTIDGEDIGEGFDRWCERGPGHVLTAIPGDGWEFYHWEGDVEGMSLAERMSTTLAISGERPCDLSYRAVFRKAGSGVHLIPTKFATLAAALASDQVGEGDVIRFTAGTHVFDSSAHVMDETTTYSCLGAIRKSVIVEGTGSSPNDTQIDCGGSGGIIVDHPEAVVRNLSFTNFVNETELADPILYVNQGVASNVCVNGLTALTAHKGFKAKTCMVYVGVGALFTDSQVFGYTNTQWTGNIDVVWLNAGTMRRCKISRNRVNAYMAQVTGAPSQVEDCEFSDNYGYSCGGVWCGKKCSVRNTLFQRNQAYGPMAICLASTGSSVFGCKMINNIYSSKGSEVLRCSNWTSVTVENCLIADNRTGDIATIAISGGHCDATFRNMTIANNAVENGQLSCFGGSNNSANKLTLVNTLIYGNTVDGAVRTFNPLGDTTYDIRNCDYPEADPNDGNGNFYAAPRFADEANGDYMPGKGSPCIDAGVDLADLPVDIDGRTRPLDGDGDGVAVTDIGCYEKPVPTEPILVALDVRTDSDCVPGQVTLTATVTGLRITDLAFEYLAIRTLGDEVTTNAVESSESTHTFTGLGIGLWSFVCRVRNGAFPPDEAVDETKVPLEVKPATTYVSLTGSNTWPYDAESKAARNLQDAVEASGRTVAVAPGVYANFTHFADDETGNGCLGVVRKPIIVEGAGSSPGDTQIDCGGSGGIIVDHPEAVVRNLSFANFVNLTATADPVLYVNQGTASNVCVNGVMTDATYKGFKAGVVHVGRKALFTDSLVFGITNRQWDASKVITLSAGTLRRCRISQNYLLTRVVQSVAHVSGDAGTIEDCEISDNYGYTCGGVDCSAKCNLRNTLITRCQASPNGYALALWLEKDGCAVSGCRIVGNVWDSSKGVTVISCSGWASAAFENCLIAGNRTYDVAPISIGGNNTVTFTNTTIADNESKCGSISCFGTGTSIGNLVLVNTIISGNTASGLVQTFNPLSEKTTYDIRHCDYPEAPAGDPNGNISADPAFRNSSRGKFSLRAGSPCVDAGDNLSWTADDVDLVGATRVYGKAVDMGCYEQGPTPGLVIFVK